MASSNVTVVIGANDIGDLTRPINELIKEIESNVEKSLDEMAKTCAMYASNNFASAIGGSEEATSPISTGYKNTGQGSREVFASGDDVAFIEFGTGVHYNDPDTYPLPRPEGIVGIGQYGNKLGRFDSWKTPSGERTHGIPAAKAMYNASVQTEQEIDRIVKEVFKG